jgi:enoyl-CoA hydratase/carnithine racemase
MGTKVAFADATYDQLLCRQDGPVAVITLNRPDELNSISATLEADLHDALDRAEADASVRAIVLTGAGDRAFSAGYDIDTFGDEAPDTSTTARMLQYWWDIDKKTADDHWHLMRLEKPVITAVKGWCLAGGFWYALCSDITIAGESATFGQPEVRESNNCTPLLVYLIGWKNAHRYSLTGDHFDAQEALRLGVVNEVVPDDEVLDRAVALAQRLALVPAESLRLNKRTTTFALEAMGIRTALEAAGFLSVLVHSASESSPDLEDMHRVRREEGLRASLKVRDDKFRPEPGGPRSKPRKEETK